MNNKGGVSQVVVQSLINTIKSEGVVGITDLDNFWAQFGWDIVCGSGEATNHVINLVEDYVNMLPNPAQQLLWWETPAGQVMKNNIQAHITDSSNSMKSLESSDLIEVIDEVVKYLIPFLFSAAEADYMESDK